MLDIKLIRDNPEAVKTGLRNRNADVDAIDKVLELDATWRAVTKALESNQNFRNDASKELGLWIRKLKGDPESPPSAELKDLVIKLRGLAEHVRKEGRYAFFESDIVIDALSADTLRQYLAQLSDYIERQKGEALALANQIEGVLLHLPNLPSAHTPVGKTEQQNVVRKEWGKKREFDFTPKPHWDLVADRGLDLEIGGRISGSGFPFFRGKIAKLERALINFFLERHTSEHGYTECWTPFMVRGETLRNSSQLPKFYEELYRADERDDLYLIPTAEVPLTSVHAGEIIADEQAPIRYCAFTPCFRREAGAAGKDTRGILRVHQFSKVELMVVTTPEQSEAEHETLTRCAETVLEKLNIPYRRLELCTGDMGFGAARCYDLEAWAPGVGKWLEVSSCSNFTDFQARRAKIRVKGKEVGTRLAHTLNGSGLACPRTMIAILENNQRADGSIAIPPALQPYYGAEEL